MSAGNSDQKVYVYVVFSSPNFASLDLKMHADISLRKPTSQDSRRRFGFFLQFRCHSLSGTSVWRPQSRYTVSRIEGRIKFPQNQRCRAKIALHPPKSRCRTFLRTPLSHFPLIAAAGRGCGGLVEGIAALLGSENGSRYRGVSQLQSHQSRYSVQLRS